MEKYNMDRWKDIIDRYADSTNDNIINKGDGLMENYNTENEFASVVSMKDIDRVGKMEKDALKKWTNQPSTFNYVIDHTRSISHLRNQVIGMIKIRLGEEMEKQNLEDRRSGKAVDDTDANEFSMGYLLNPANMRVFDATAALLRRQDFIPCDKNGKRI